MQLNEYQELALRTAAPREGEGSVNAEHDLLHAGMGFASEGGEFLDVLKKKHAYDKPMDMVNLREEIGDIMWYCAIAARGLGTTLEDIATINIQKLAKRYPERFTAEAALNRDLDGERAVLEKSPLPPAKPDSATLGNGHVVRKEGNGWCVAYQGEVLAKTGPDGRTLRVVGSQADGPWLFAAQVTLDEILK